MISLSTLYFAQNCECFYCGEWTWITGDLSIARIKERLGLPADAPRKRVNARQATREHLRRRADGGESTRENLIMACYECNSTRHATPVLIHLGRMRDRAALRAARPSV